MSQPDTITKLPDGSALFTATILSEAEAMALPLKERPLNYRISGELYHAVFETVGAASMCWNPPPVGTFESEKASDFAVKLCFLIADERDEATSKLDDIRAAVTAYYLALDRREHAGIAQSHTVKAIEKILGMHWEQGKALAEFNKKEGQPS